MASSFPACQAIGLLTLWVFYVGILCGPSSQPLLFALLCSPCSQYFIHLHNLHTCDLHTCDAVIEVIVTTTEEGDTSQAECDWNDMVPS